MEKYILVDLGKTIVDNYGYDYERGLYSIYKETDQIIPFEEFKRVESILHKNLFKNAKLTNTEVNLNDFFTMILEITNLKCRIEHDNLDSVFMDTFAEDEGLMEGSLELLEFLSKEGFLIYALSNSCISSKGLEFGLSKLNVSKYFTKIISSSDCLYRKPDHHIFEIGINEIREKNKEIRTEDIFFLGNDYNCDVVGGHEAGLSVIWINWNNEEDVKKLAKYNCTNYKELIELLYEESK